MVEGVPDVGLQVSPCICTSPHIEHSLMSSLRSALYMFGYGIFYFLTRLAITRAVSIILYFSYTFVFCVLFFLMTGTVGFLSW